MAVSKQVTSTTVDLNKTMDRVRRNISKMERELAEVKEDINLVLQALAKQAEEAKTQEAPLPTKPRSPEVMAALKRSKKLAEEIRRLPREEQIAQFKRNMEEIRAEAIAKGTAIDDEREAAIGD